MEAVSRDWASRAALPQHVVQMVNNFPSNLHPMSQFSAGITAMQSESKFAKAYNEGVPKTKYWEVRERERERSNDDSLGFILRGHGDFPSPLRLILLLRVYNTV